MSNLISHFLEASLKHYAYSPLESVHPLDFYANFAPGGMRTLTTQFAHPNKVGSDVIKLIMFCWDKPLTWLDTRSIMWSINKFPTTVLERILSTMKPSATLPPDIVSKLTMHLADLEQSLLAHDPMMPQHLKQSHKLLISYPETVHLLDDTEIARLISAAQIHSQIEIVKASVPKTGGRKKISAEDL